MLIVGVDHSDNARAALRWALTFAATRDDAIHAVHAMPPLSDLVSRTDEAHQRHASAQRELHDTVEAVRRAERSTVTVTPYVGAGAPTDVLREAAEDLGADLIVVGRRGLGAVATAVAGSVSTALTRTADVPVVVVPGPDHSWPPVRRVVVGVDGSERAAAALRWAAKEAALRDADLVALHAEPLTMVPGATFGPLYPAPFPEPGQARRVLDDAIGKLAAHLGRSARVERRVYVGAAGPALVGAVGPDDLLVVGRRGIGRIARLLLGSTSSYCVHHAACPVVVVP